MRGIKYWIKEAWEGSDNFNTLMEKGKTPDAKVVKSTFFREQVESTSFKRLMKYHDFTPQIQIAISSYTELITGTEMIVSAEEGQEKAKEFIEDWINRTGFYDKFESLVRTILICGTGILELLDENDTTDVSEVDMASIITKKRDDFGKTLYYEQQLQSGGTQKIGESNIDRFCEFQLTNYSKQAWGKSLFHALAVPRTVDDRTMSPVVEVLWSMEDAMAGIIQNNAYPITTITYPGANDKYLEKEAERWRKYKPGDKRVQKIKPEIEFFETQPGSKYTDYITHLEKTVELGTQFPHDIMTGDFTSRASSETTESIVQKKVRGFQRYLANKLKTAIFDRILLQNAFDPDKVNLVISFTAQNVVELEPDQVLKLYNDGAITIDECRNWYKENTGIDLPDDEKITDDIKAKQELEQQRFNDQVQSLEKKIEKVTIDKYNDDKIREMAANLEQQMNGIKQSISEEKESAATRKIKALEKYIKTVEDIKK